MLFIRALKWLLFHMCHRNSASETIKQKLVFVGSEEGKLLALRQSFAEVRFLLEVAVWLILVKFHFIGGQRCILLYVMDFDLKRMELISKNKLLYVVLLILLRGLRLLGYTYWLQITPYIFLIFQNYIRILTKFCCETFSVSPATSPSQTALVSIDCCSVTYHASHWQADTFTAEPPKFITCYALKLPRWLPKRYHLFLSGFWDWIVWLFVIS